jgi:hypothetical protein
MFAKKTDTSTRPKYTERYSPHVQALCDVAISIIQDMKRFGNESQGFGGDVSEEVLQRAIMGTDRHLSGYEWDQLARLFSDLYKTTIYQGVFQDCEENDALLAIPTAEIAGWCESCADREAVKGA